MRGGYDKGHWRTSQDKRARIMELSRLFADFPRRCRQDCRMIPGAATRGLRRVYNP